MRWEYILLVTKKINRSIHWKVLKYMLRVKPVSNIVTSVSTGSSQRG